MLTRRNLLQTLAAPLAAGAEAGTKYAVFDSRVIESVRNARLVPGTVRKDARPLFAEDKPWEVRVDNVYANVMFDEELGLFRCWYSPFIQFDDVWSGQKWVKPAGVASSREMAICYATSKDGVTWEKPELGLVEWRGNKRNNMVWREPHGAGIFKDARESDPAKRFKMFFNGIREGRHSEMQVSFSRDGLHWSPPQACAGIAARGDTHNNAFWDARSGKYVAITRLADGQRLVGRTESADFLHWTKAVEVLRGDVAKQTYGMPTFPYCGAYLGLVMMFDTKRNVVDCELAWSPDTVRWERLCPGTPLIPRGPEGSHDHGCIYGAAYPIERNGEVILYYGGNDHGHDGPRKGFFCRARLRQDGFVALLSEGAAEVVTKPLPCSGRKLRVAADGDVRVSLVGSAFSANAGADIDVTKFKGKNVQLRFELRDARLYTFEFAG